MAQDAGIQLQVGFDLAYFRNQLPKLGVAAAGYPLTFNVEFDRRSIQNELNALGANIKKRNYFLEVKTNLEAEIKNAKDLATALDNLARSSAAAKTSVGQSLGVGAIGRKPSQGGLGSGDVKKLYRASARAGLLAFDEEIARNKISMVATMEQVGIDAIAGLLNGLNSQDSRLRAAAEYLGETLIKTTKTSLGIASPSKEFEKIGKNVGEGFEKGALSSMDKAFDALERQLQARLRKLQGMMQPSVSRRGAFPFVAKSGPIESQALMSESVALAQQLDQARAQIAQIQQRREGRLSFERASLSQTAGRMLPAGRSAVPMTSAQELVVKSFYANMRNGNRMLRENFSANSYFPKATKALASAMDEATSGMKALPGARGPIAALPSTEMLDRRKFQSAMERAAQVDAQNAARQQAARINATMQMRQQLSALPPLTAPSIGGGNVPLSRAGAYSLNKANQLLGLPVGPSSPLGSMGRFPMSGMMGRGSMGQFPVDPMLAVGGASAMGQKVAGPYPFSNTARSARGGYISSIGSSAFFPMSGMMGPSSPLGSITPQSSMFGKGGPPRPPSGGGGGGMGGAGSFGRALGGINLPGTGVVREIGNEFAMATKQVLLFGTAYKALAFATSFPAQVGQAVGALQSFNNTLKAISPTAQEAKASNQFILDIVDRYNVPLQSARDGFTKLYASMAPAGFKGDEIRALFTGVSQAAATFGMSAEKVDRVNYAFAQMASKGQVMSEELKGQLGDVLPGAMGIFAEAAGFEGKDAIEKFSKALEDGAYKGDAMRVLLKNVTGVLQKEFGPGAEGAARTFQGVINRMQNSTKLLYEAFEPVAVGFLNAVVVPMTNGIKTLSDGFNAFFKGQAAETIGGGAVAQQLNDLKPAFEGILANIKALIPSFQIFGAVVFNAVKLLTAFAGNPIVGFLFTVYTNVLLVNAAFKLLGGQILVGLVASINTAIVRIVALGYAVNALGVQTTGARTALAGTQLQMLLLQRSAAGMVGPLTLSNLAMAALAGKAALVVGGLVLLGKGVYDTNETFRNFVNNIGGVIASDFRDAVDGMAKDAGNSADNIEKSYKDLTTKLNPIGQFIKQLFRDVFKDTSDSAQASATQSTNSFNEFFNSLSINAAAGFNGLSAVISQWWANLPAPIRRIFEGNAVSTLIGAGQYAVGAANRAAAPNAQATGMFGKYIPGSAQTKIPTTSGSAATTPIGAVVGGGGTGGTGGGAKGGKGRESQAALLKLEVEYNKELMSLESQIFSAQLGENTLLVTRLEGERELLKLKYELAKVNLEEIPAKDKKLKIQVIGQQAELVRLKVRSSMEEEITRAINEQQKAVEELQAASQLEVNNKKMYADLLEKGIAPAQAKILIEVDNEINKIQTALELTQKRVKAEIDVLKALKAQGKAIDENSLESLERQYGETGDAINALPGIAAEETGRRFALAAPASASVRMRELADESRLALEKLNDPVEQLKAISESVSESIGSAFKGLITGATTVQEALANMFQSIADSFADMVAQMITEWLKAQLIEGFMSFFNMLPPGGGGVGSAFADSAGGAAGFGGSFDSGIAPLPNIPDYSGAFKTAANGAVWAGGFQAFANGGIVTGPTLGLVGEGRYNEAVIPLPDGKSVPVELGGAMGNQITSNIVVNVSSDGKTSSSGAGSDSAGLGRKLEGAVKQVIVDELRPGGLLSGRR